MDRIEPRDPPHQAPARGNRQPAAAAHPPDLPAHRSHRTLLAGQIATRSTPRITASTSSGNCSRPRPPLDFPGIKSDTTPSLARQRPSSTYTNRRETPPPPPHPHRQARQCPSPLAARSPRHDGPRVAKSPPAPPTPPRSRTAAGSLSTFRASTIRSCKGTQTRTPLSAEECRQLDVRARLRYRCKRETSRCRGARTSTGGLGDGPRRGRRRRRSGGDRGGPVAGPGPAARGLAESRRGEVVRGRGC